MVDRTERSESGEKEEKERKGTQKERKDDGQCKSANDQRRVERAWRWRGRGEGEREAKERGRSDFPQIYYYSIYYPMVRQSRCILATSDERGEGEGEGWGAGFDPKGCCLVLGSAITVPELCLNCKWSAAADENQSVALTISIYRTRVRKSRFL